jgi:G8 domain
MYQISAMEKLVTVTLTLLSLLPCIVDAATLRRNHTTTQHTPTKPIAVVRNLQVAQSDFLPLLCNAGLASAPCTLWTKAFGTKSQYTNRVVIPCGQCITMNFAGASLQLLGGLEIIGKLVIPNKVKLNLSTTTIVVQGELQMTSTKPVNGVPDVKITLTGNDDVTFTPVDRNVNACHGVSTCTAGKKSIVVAGGKISGTSKTYYILVYVYKYISTLSHKKILL